MNRRIEYWHSPDATQPNSLVPASNLLVVNEHGQILMQRRRDTDQWALPGGKQDLGETPSQCAVRECEEETGVVAEVTGLLGVYSDPTHLVEYTSDGEVRQEYEVNLNGRSLRRSMGQPHRAGRARHPSHRATPDRRLPGKPLPGRGLSGDQPRVSARHRVPDLHSTGHPGPMHGMGRRVARQDLIDALVVGHQLPIWAGG